MRFATIAVALALCTAEILVEWALYITDRYLVRLADGGAETGFGAGAEADSDAGAEAGSDADANHGHNATRNYPRATPSPTPMPPTFPLTP